MIHNQPSLTKLLNQALKAALKAGKKILEIYSKDNFKVEHKIDNSPLTIADKKAHSIIEQELQKSNIPLLSEESSTIPYIERKKWRTFWLVDPLDGTKEFIKRNGEFTVNIALIENNKPILGVVFAPVLNKIYYGHSNQAYLVENIDLSQTNDNLFAHIRDNSISLPLKITRNNFIVVASRSHLSPETKSFIEQLKRKKNNVEMISIGSSLKLCLIAEGNADIYPRYAPTMEWDIAAGQALIEATGGQVLNADDNTTLLYNKENQLNPWFIASNKLKK
jgi:3'(2'), 5'-bisphosphate nucleotidase